MQCFATCQNQCGGVCICAVGVSLLAVSGRGTPPFFEGVAVMSFSLKIFSDFGYLMCSALGLTIGSKLTELCYLAVKIHKIYSTFI